MNEKFGNPSLKAENSRSVLKDWLRTLQSTTVATHGFQVSFNWPLFVLIYSEIAIARKKNFTLHSEQAPESRE